jgi:hypothetical protein
MSAPRSKPRGSTKNKPGMEVCTQCLSELVQPVEWWEREGNTWGVELRCPECESRRAAVFSQAEVDRYDRKLDDGSRALSSDLRALTRENMEHEAETFVAALEAGAILPEDFAPGPSLR